jgi:RNA polymerase sigma-70 factor, ECF subfamily
VSENELEWLHKAQKGDVEAFTHLLDTYEKPVFNLCYRMLGDGYEAEDAAQETFLRAYNGLGRYDAQRPFSSWLLSIAAHYCIDQIRRRRISTVSYDEIPYLDPPDRSPGPEASFVREEDQQHVQKLLANLGTQDRAAVIMRYWYDMSYEEIGETLSLTVSAVKSRLHRAKKELAQLQIQNGYQSASLERTHHESPAF